MATISERILRLLTSSGPLEDDVLAHRLGISTRQSIDQAARLEAEGRIVRRRGSGGKVVNELADPTRGPIPRQSPRIPAVRAGTPPVVRGGMLKEDDVKQAVETHLVGRGFDVQVARGSARSVELDARHPNGSRLLIEAKGEAASDQQQGSYFLGALGELVQRMNDPAARYAIALPDNRRYRALVQQLPELARQSLGGLVVFWVCRQVDGSLTVREDQPPPEAGPDPSYDHGVGHAPRHRADHY